MQLLVCTHVMWVGMPTPLCIKQFRFRDKHTPEMSLVKHIIERNWRLPFRFPNQSYLDFWYPRLTEPRPKSTTLPRRQRQSVYAPWNQINWSLVEKLTGSSETSSLASCCSFCRSANCFNEFVAVLSNLHATFPLQGGSRKAVECTAPRVCLSSGGERRRLPVTLTVFHDMTELPKRAAHANC